MQTFRPIGIVGGAGPMAGVLMLEKIFRIAQERYGCHHDADFPKVFLLSFPFSNMLSSSVDSAQMRKELDSCLTQLRGSGAEALAIACNTLHLFLEEDKWSKNLVHLPKEVAKQLGGQIPLVLCTSTSANAKLHYQFFPCRYPSAAAQQQTDQAIDWILKGEPDERVMAILSAVLAKEESASTVILGCTELSLLKNPLTRLGKKIIDPLEIAAETILIKSRV